MRFLILAGLSCLGLGMSFTPRAQAQDFERYSQSLSTQKEPFEHLFALALWARDHYDLREWEAYRTRLENWMQSYLKQAHPEAEKLTLQALYYLLLKQPQQAQKFLILRQNFPHNERSQLVSLLRGEKLSKNSRLWRLSEADVRKFRRRYPDSQWGASLLVDALLEKQNVGEPQVSELQEAQNILEKVLATRPKNLYFRYQNAQIIHLLGNKESAQQLFSDLSAEAQPSVSEAIGDFYAWQNEPLSAILFLSRARQAMPELERLYVKLENAYLPYAPQELLPMYLEALGQADAPAFLSQRLRRLMPRFPDWPWEQALQKAQLEKVHAQVLQAGLLRLRERPGARALLEKTLEQSPGRLDAYLSLLEIYWENQDDKALEALLERARQNKLSHPELEYWRGVLHVQRRELKQAVAVFEALGPYNEQSQYMLALVYRELGEYELARQILNNLFENDQQNVKLILALGDLDLDAQKYRQAERYYRYALRLAPYRASVYYSLGNLYAGQDQFSNAAYLYERAVLLEPEALEIRNNLGNAYIRLGAYYRAKQLYEHVIQQAPHYATAYYNLACIHALQGQGELALSFLRRAFELEPELKTTAQSDRDLDRVKHLKQFKALLNARN